jgi:hypothetical protein
LGSDIALIIPLISNKTCLDVTLDGKKKKKKGISILLISAYFNILFKIGAAMAMIIW